jgi:hypothetical protein
VSVGDELIKLRHHLVRQPDGDLNGHKKMLPRLG